MSILKPEYYRSSTIDVIDMCHMYSLSFDIGNVLKYSIRAGSKDSSKKIEDLEKAKEYLNRRIEFLKNEGKNKTR
jgi:hypothetical protein